MTWHLGRVIKRTEDAGHFNTELGVYRHCETSRDALLPFMPT